MKSAVKKIYVPIAGILMGVAAQANAAVTPINMGMKAQANVADDSSSSQYHEHKTSCCGAHPGMVTFKGDLLYWRAELCGLESAFGSTTIKSSADGTTITRKESDKEPDFKWDLGFRVGADVAFGSRFDLDAEWTHFNGRAKFREHDQHGHWKIDYNVVDLLFGGTFWARPCFSLKPFIGLRGAWIHQSLKSHLETLFKTAAGNSTVFTRINAKENFWGVGPEIGLEADWYFGCHFSLYGSFDFVTYYGDVKGKNFDKDTFAGTVNVCNGKRKHCFNDIATDLAFGIRWDRTWDCKDCNVNFILKLGLEQHRIYDFSNLGSDGTLSLDGGIFEVGIGFCY